jgi:hypothetical protein
MGELYESARQPESALRCIHLTVHPCRRR